MAAINHHAAVLSMHLSLAEGDDPAAAAGPFILRGSLRERLRMTPSRLAPRAPQDDGFVRIVRA
jgi:hypothetical protein